VLFFLSFVLPAKRIADRQIRRYKTMLETHVGELSSRMKRGLEQCLAKLRQTEEQLEIERRRRSALEEQIRSEAMLAPSSGSSV
jgi:stress response protein YsnF